MYAQPDNIDDALQLLRDSDSKQSTADAAVPWTILSGGTDVYPSSFERAMPRRILDIHSLYELKHIDQDAKRIRIGAGVTWSDLIAAELPPAFDALKLAAREVGSVQIQNQATLVGNLCNASPAADGVPPLLVLGALVELKSTKGVRELPLSEFILGNRLTARHTDEMVTAILIPAESATGHSTFLKLGARKYLIISISMVAARLAYDEQGLITDAALSVGSCSLVAQRLTALEHKLIAKRVDSDLAALVSAEHIESLAPIDDVRSSALYREQASIELIQRTLTNLGRSFV